MITSIIFSKNRACQLDLLLRSIEQNLPHLTKDIKVLCKPTKLQFVAGYRKLWDRFSYIDWYEEECFYKDVTYLLDMSNKYVCFFVDDNIIYKKCSLDFQMVDYVFGEVKDLTCMSLRLGTNTTVQDPYNNIPTIFPQTIYQLPVESENVLLWNWKMMNGFGNFNYPFSVDGHIYNSDYIIPLLNYEFDTPNAFEGRFDKNKLNTNTMACFEQSVLVNNPLNLVGSSNNNAGKFWGYTLEELNEKYLDNNQISLNSIMNKKIVGCHQELEIDFEEI